MSEHKERPLVFSSEMVVAILEGRKTQTRRVVKFRHQTAKMLGQQHEHKYLQSVYPASEDGWVFWTSIYSDRLAVLTKKAYKHGFQCPHGKAGDRLWVKETWNPPINDSDVGKYTAYKATFTYRNGTAIPEVITAFSHWKPSRFMPRWASRIDLEITSVSVERLQDISDTDAKAEGFYAKEILISYWDELNAHRNFPWSSNPWVWVIKFRKV
jgi:hypothetical protein